MTHDLSVMDALFFEIRAEYYELSGDLHLRGEISKESDQCVVNYLSN